MLRYVIAGSAYDNYYSNLGKMYASSMAFIDRSLHKDTRMPFLAVRERFSRWFEQHRSDDVVVQSAARMIQTNRVMRRGDASNPLQGRISEARSQGKKIICCFGKILCDLGVPYDGGPAHSDIVDWLNHTIDVCSRDPDILLLIKPHPHEERPEIALDLSERLVDVIPDQLPGNVMVLGYKDFNVHEVANYLDLAILWNGTSSLELTALGIPVVMCAHFGRLDYPIDLIYPEDRKQYQDFILSKNYPIPNEELRLRALALIHYMGSSEVALPNVYSLRAATNDDVGVPTWNEAALLELHTGGDRCIQLAAEQILEGVKLVTANSNTSAAQ
jgi:capsular polysaccharide export protein